MDPWKSSPSWSASWYLFTFFGRKERKKNKTKQNKTKNKGKSGGCPLLVHFVFLVWVVSNALFVRVENLKLRTYIDPVLTTIKSFSNILNDRFIVPERHVSFRQFRFRNALSVKTLET